MPDQTDGVPPPIVDRRRPAFCYQTLDALAVIRETFAGAKRSTALAIYLSFTEVANAKGGAAARDGFRATRKEVAVAAGVSPDTLDRYVREFERLELLAVERQSIGPVNLPNTWALIDAPAPSSRTDAATPSRTGAAQRARDPLSDKKQSEEGRADALPAVPAPAPVAMNRPVTVDKRNVTDAEYDIAARVLAVFNRIAGTRYGSSEWVAKIITRHREQPSLTVAQHEEVIRVAFTDPWWTGPPSPSVVYGNARVFEKAIHSIAHAPSRGLSPEEMKTYGTVWGPGTEYASLAEARAGADVVEAEFEEVVDG